MQIEWTNRIWIHLGIVIKIFRNLDKFNILKAYIICIRTTWKLKCFQADIFIIYPMECQ